jgi:hypothetical protein
LRNLKIWMIWLLGWCGLQQQCFDYCRLEVRIPPWTSTCKPVSEASIIGLYSRVGTECVRSLMLVEASCHVVRTLKTFKESGSPEAPQPKTSASLSAVGVTQRGRGACGSS